MPDPISTGVSFIQIFIWLKDVYLAIKKKRDAYSIFNSYLKPIRIIHHSFNNIEIEVFNYGPGWVRSLKTIVIGLNKIAYAKGFDEKKETDPLKHLNNTIFHPDFLEVQGLTEIKPESSAKYVVTNIFKFKHNSPIIFEWKTLVGRKKTSAWRQIQTKSNLSQKEFIEIRKSELKKLKKQLKREKSIYKKAINNNTEEELR